MVFQTFWLKKMKTKILFSWWRKFLTWSMSYVLMLTLQWIRYQQNLGTWFSDAVIVFLGVSNYWALSSTEIFKINMCFVYGLDTGSVWIMRASLSSTSEVIIECVSIFNYFFLLIPMFSFNLSWLFEGVQGAEEGSVVISGRFLSILPFFFSSFNSVDRGWWVIIFCCRFWNYDILLKISKLWGLKTYVEYFDRYQIF